MTGTRSLRSRILTLRPQDPYALKDIQNVEGYLERQKLQAVDSAYDRAMRIGYAAAQQRDYQTALKLPPRSERAAPRSLRAALRR